jgi:putative tricarboxylic transport membrane protein
MALYSSVTGDTFSDVVLMTVAPLIALAALKMSPVEIVSLMIFAFSIISALVGDSVVKGMVAAALGLFFATVGLDPENATPRFLFGRFELYQGLPLVSVAIGMLTVPEIFRRLASISGKSQPAVIIPSAQNPADRRVSWAEYWSCRYTLLRGSVIGTLFGAIPGLDSSAAAFMNYATVKQTSRDPDSFGKGNIHGIAATESANSSVCGANLIPLLTLGIPGNVAAALIITALMIHGIQPGPLLFQEQGRMIYGLFGAFILGNACNLVTGLVGLRVWVRLISAPESFVFSASLLLCIVGVYLSTGGLFGVWVMFFFAVLGFLMNAFGYSVIVFVIAFFLGERFELSLSQSLNIMDGDFTFLLTRPVALALLFLALFSACWLGRRRTEKRTGHPSAGAPEQK